MPADCGYAGCFAPGGPVAVVPRVLDFAGEIGASGSGVGHGVAQCFLGERDLMAHCWSSEGGYLSNGAPEIIGSSPGVAGTGVSPFARGRKQ